MYKSKTAVPAKRTANIFQIGSNHDLTDVNNTNNTNSSSILNSNGSFNRLHHHLSFRELPIRTVNELQRNALFYGLDDTYVTITTTYYD